MDADVAIWLEPPCSYRLSHNEVHVCKVVVSNLPLVYVMQLAQLLSSDEQQQAQRFQFDRHRKMYIVSHGLLRVLLSRYTDSHPEEIDFSYGHKGKPFLKEKTRSQAIFFSLSHTTELVLYAFAKCRWLGVDVEYMRTAASVDGIAKRYFYPNENRMLSRFAVEQRKEAFYKLWTCKEAYLKATGEGLAGLEQVEILQTNDRHVSIKWHGLTDHAHGTWFLCQMEPQPYYSGALVIKGSNWDIKYYNLGMKS